MFILFGMYNFDPAFILFDKFSSIFSSFFGLFWFSNKNMFWAFYNFILILKHINKDISRTSNIAFLLDWAQMSDLDFGLIRQNISIKKASFQYQGCPLSLKSGKLWLNSYVYWISITSNWFYSQQFSLPYSKNILSVWPFRGDKKKKKKVLVNPTEFFH
jgi:hypothetical protein